jgi:hypothetical protein
MNNELVNKYIDRVETGIKNALTKTTKLGGFHLGLEGMSSTYNRILMNNLVSNEDRYLEIGVWRGSMFVSALYENDPNAAIAIDNFSQFDGDQKKFLHNCEIGGVKRCLLITADCFNLPEEDKEHVHDINVYFYDGDHREEDQRKALTYYIDKLADVFIFIVDDWNHEPARTGTRLGISDVGLIIHKEWELPAKYNGDVDGWWNGLYVAVCEKTK